MAEPAIEALNGVFAGPTLERVAINVPSGSQVTGQEKVTEDFLF